MGMKLRLSKCLIGILMSSMISLSLWKSGPGSERNSEAAGVLKQKK